MHILLQAPSEVIPWVAFAFNGRVTTAAPPPAPGTPSLLGLDLLNPPAELNPNIRPMLLDSVKNFTIAEIG
jgi:hypothetical protein